MPWSRLGGPGGVCVPVGGGLPDAANNLRQVSEPETQQPPGISISQLIVLFFISRYGKRRGVQPESSAGLPTS